MPREGIAGKPSTRRYSEEEKAAAVRMVRSLRAELGTSQGTITRVAEQLGYGTESVRIWVRRADAAEGIEGPAPPVRAEKSEREKQLEQEVRELWRVNEILKRAASFFGAELDRQHK
ncbi:transposase [Georgenia halophila]|uniref:Transposase n=1 Tax=Georgenia halophila TaxID=620889 RepID=A0ABP8KSP7_9MICO